MKHEEQPQTHPLKLLGLSDEETAVILWLWDEMCLKLFYDYTVIHTEWDGLLFINMSERCRENAFDRALREHGCVGKYLRVSECPTIGVK